MSDIDLTARQLLQHYVNLHNELLLNAHPTESTNTSMFQMRDEYRNAINAIAVLHHIEVDLGVSGFYFM